MINGNFILVCTCYALCFALACLPKGRRAVLLGMAEKKPYVHRIEDSKKKVFFILKYKTFIAKHY